ncbi:MAG: hypothetical protein MSA36_08425 [Treponema porcinum]|uniref:hypothetical protein n=1 Tax=Treponema porcinum TaxID=261392 RepID=UPI002354C370|nr:hypothetical protein [Treponema porcinum]MCI7535000.1 hypothetical protein [Treponema porcinum]
MPIEEIIEKSFNDLIKAITTDGTSSQLIFPHSNKGDVRHSEQELKQIFLRNVEEDKNYFYSIETPTEYGYRFSDTEMPLVKENHEKDDKYESARFDVSLYSKNNKDDLLTHVEFKYGNPDKKSGICKDFLKLVSEVKFTNEKKNFFVHYLCVKTEKGWESRTFPSLFSKYLDSVADIIKSDLINEEDLSKVTVYLLCIFEEPEAESEPKIALAYHFSLADLKNYKVRTKYSDLTDKSWLNEELI